MSSNFDPRSKDNSSQPANNPGRRNQNNFYLDQAREADRLLPLEDRSFPRSNPFGADIFDQERLRSNPDFQRLVSETMNRRMEEHFTRRLSLETRHAYGDNFGHLGSSQYGMFHGSNNVMGNQNEAHGSQTYPMNMDSRPAENQSANFPYSESTGTMLDSTAPSDPAQDADYAMLLDENGELDWDAPIPASWFNNTRRSTTASSLNQSSPTAKISLRREQLRQSNDQALASSANTSLQLTDPAPTAPPVAHGIQLISTNEMPDRFRTVFPFPVFNAVQSKCFHTLYNSNDNVVVSAPTASGKTALLELAICKLFGDDSSRLFKIVYLAPTKSLCSQRGQDWSRKFNQMGLSCAELTGDSDSTDMKRGEKAHIIVTTPEKWDSITRKWADHIAELRTIRLFLIDEVHMLKESRGATLEAVVSRMKSMGTHIRFIALSATIPNSEDIAVWLGKNYMDENEPAYHEQFDQDFRPAKLEKHVYGFKSAQNDYVFDKFLDEKLPELITKHTQKKPMLVFCFTRKSCETLAERLAAWWRSSSSNDRPWPATNERIGVTQTNLQDLAQCGVAFHHGGVHSKDRSTIETAFLNRQISVICCTSTLAVGVNLPCHLVVIKGTVGYQDGRPVEYSDLEIMQMLGRAGRPQFDSNAVAIIMTRSKNVQRYQKMISGQEVLESTLHLNLIEHLNSEIERGAIHNIDSAKKWLAGTFLSVRMRQNPGYYKFDFRGKSQSVDEKLGKICERDIKLLRDIQAITDKPNFSCTTYGVAMSRYMVRYSTMKMLLLDCMDGDSIRQILQVLSQADEFKDIRLKPEEREFFRQMNEQVRYDIKGTIATTAHKVSLMIQGLLGTIDPPPDAAINRSQYVAEQDIICGRMSSLIRCLIDCAHSVNDAITMKNAMELNRSIIARCWENMPNQLMQIPNIGPAALRKLVGANINSVEKLNSQDTASIERILSRNPPFARKILDALKEFPKLKLEAQVVGRIVRAGNFPEVKVNAQISFNNEKVPLWNRRAPLLTFVSYLSSGTLLHTWQGTMRKLDTLLFTAKLTSPKDSIICFVTCDEIVGTLKSLKLSPNVPPAMFPRSSSKPTSSPAKVQTPVEEKDDSEYDDDDLDDMDLLAAAHEAEAKAPKKVDDDFMDIDELTDSDDKMPNGKWRCCHSCSGGITKAGNRCQHKCCHEGLPIKPRRIPKRARNNPNFETQSTNVVKSNDKSDKLGRDQKKADTIKLKLRVRGTAEKSGHSEPNDTPEYEGSPLSDMESPTDPFTDPFDEDEVEDSTEKTPPNSRRLKRRASALQELSENLEAQIRGKISKRMRAEKNPLLQAQDSKEAESKQQQKVPEWLKDVDPEIVEKFSGIVDFV